MQQFNIRVNEYLRTQTRAFYSVPYLGHRKPGNPDYLNTLKNTFNTEPKENLRAAQNTLRQVLEIDFPKIRRALGLNTMTVCVVPRAKARYAPSQLLFRETVRSVVDSLDGFVDGTGCLSRHTDTRTTHLVGVEHRMLSYNNNGSMPYKGITKGTCHLAPAIRGVDILLVDDIYTPRVNIDEDAIEALLDEGARSVAFYAVGKTGG